MRSKGFKIICNECGNVVEVKDDTSNVDYLKTKYSFYPIQNERINITCNKCHNEVFIGE